MTIARKCDGANEALGPCGERARWIAVRVYPDGYEAVSLLCDRCAQKRRSWTCDEVAPLEALEPAQ